MWCFSHGHPREPQDVSLNNGAVSILLATQSSTGVSCRNWTSEQLLCFSFISLFYMKMNIRFNVFPSGKPWLKSLISKPRQKWLVKWWISLLLPELLHTQPREWEEVGHEKAILRSPALRKSLNKIHSRSRQVCGEPRMHWTLEGSITWSHLLF